MKRNISKGKYILTCSSKEEWDELIDMNTKKETTTYKLRLKNNFSQKNDSMIVIDGSYRGYCDLQYFKLNPDYRDHTFLHYKDLNLDIQVIETEYIML